MSRKRINHNRPFMVFNAILFIAVLGVTAIFLYLSYAFKRDTERSLRTYKGTYQIEISKDFAGDDIGIYLNDRLVLNRTMPDSALRLDIRRFAEEHTLIVVDNKTDKASPFNLHKEGSEVIVKKKEGEIIIEETPSRF